MNAPRTEAPIEPLIGIDDLAGILSVCRRKVESMRSSGRLPKPDLHLGRLPRWKPETIRRWIDALAEGRGGRP